MSSKRIYIENFRNIGFNPNNEENKACEFILNRSTNPDYIGDLVILLGKNNSGKSNILYALRTLYDFKYNKESDIPNNLTFYNNKNTKKLVPKIYLNEKESITLSCDKNKSTEWKDKINSIKSQIRNISQKVFLKDYKSKDLFNIAELEEKTKLKNIEFDDLQLLDIFNYSTIYDNNDDIKTLIQKIENAINFIKKNDYILNLSNILKYKNYFDSIEKYLIKCNKELDSFIDIHLIKDEQYKVEDFYLNCNKPSITNNKLFQALLHIMNINIDDFFKYVIKPNKILNIDYISELNKNINKVNDEFNKIFSLFNSNTKYQFSILSRLNSTSLVFTINLKSIKDNEIISQEYKEQSEGFKWFFNFFFNFWSIVCKNKSNNMVILLDEPGIRFSKLSLSQFRFFLKNLTKMYGITFVLTTHRSEWIDLDYLEELRIVKKENTIATVENNFNCQYDKKEIWLLNIIRAIEANIIDNGDESIFDEFCIQKTFVFVEGISDYLFLTGIKINLLNSNELGQEFNKKLKHTFFIPLNGLKRLDKNNKLELHKYLNIFQSKKCFILVDDDEAGSICKDKLKNENIEIKKLSEFITPKNIKENKFEMEDLLDTSDQEKYKITKESKKNDNDYINNAYEFKRALIKDKNLIHKNTFNNLETLILGLIK